MAENYGCVKIFFRGARKKKDAGNLKIAKFPKSVIFQNGKKFCKKFFSVASCFSLRNSARNSENSEKILRILQKFWKNEKFRSTNERVFPNEKHKKILACTVWTYIILMHSNGADFFWICVASWGGFRLYVARKVSFVLEFYGGCGGFQIFGGGGSIFGF